MSRPPLLIAAVLASALLPACAPYDRTIAPAARGLEPLNQPVVSRTDYVLDLNAGYDGLASGESDRLAAWLASLEVQYGDELYVDESTPGSGRTAIAAVAKRYELQVSPGAPVTTGRVPEGTARVILSRSEAYVPGCPKWAQQDDVDGDNAQSPGYGCTVNGNLAAMVADPEDLLRGRDEGALADLRTIGRVTKGLPSATASGAPKGGAN